MSNSGDSGKSGGRPPKIDDPEQQDLIARNWIESCSRGEFAIPQKLRERFDAADIDADNRAIKTVLQRLVAAGRIEMRLDAQDVVPTRDMDLEEALQRRWPNVAKFYVFDLSTVHQDAKHKMLSRGFAPYFLRKEVAGKYRSFGIGSGKTVSCFASEIERLASTRLQPVAARWGERDIEVYSLAGSIFRGAMGGPFDADNNAHRFGAAIGAHAVNLVDLPIAITQLEEEANVSRAEKDRVWLLEAKRKLLDRKKAARASILGGFKDQRDDPGEQSDKILKNMKSALLPHLPEMSVLGVGTWNGGHALHDYSHALDRVREEYATSLQALDTEFRELNALVAFVWRYVRDKYGIDWICLGDIGNRLFSIERPPVAAKDPVLALILQEVDDLISTRVNPRLVTISKSLLRLSSGLVLMACGKKHWAVRSMLNRTIVRFDHVCIDTEIAIGLMGD